MSAPVLFVVCTPSGRVEAMLNSVMVGVIAPWRGDGAKLGNVAATYQLFMSVNGAIRNVPRPISSMFKARRAILTSLADWHEQADPVRYAAMIEDLRTQAENERES